MYINVVIAWEGRTNAAYPNIRFQDHRIVADRLNKKQLEAILLDDGFVDHLSTRVGRVGGIVNSHFATFFH